MCIFREFFLVFKLMILKNNFTMISFRKRPCHYCGPILKDESASEITGTGALSTLCLPLATSSRLAGPVICYLKIE